MEKRQPSDQLSRRDFLRITAGALAATGISIFLPGCGPAGAPAVATPAGVVAGMVDTSRFKKDPP